MRLIPRYMYAQLATWEIIQLLVNYDWNNAERMETNIEQEIHLLTSFSFTPSRFGIF